MTAVSQNIKNSGIQVRPEEKPLFEKFKPPDKKQYDQKKKEDVPDEPPPAEVVQRQEKNQTEMESPSLALLDVLSLLQQQSRLLVKWMGSRTYESVVRGRKKSTGFRKGTMVDRRVE